MFIKSFLDFIYNKREDFLYAGYSAGVCVLGPTLESVKIVDDPTDKPYKEINKPIMAIKMAGQVLKLRPRKEVAHFVNEVIRVQRCRKCSLVNSCISYTTIFYIDLGINLYTYNE